MGGAVLQGHVGWGESSSSVALVGECLAGW
jgi:hypothetical protein